MEGRSYFWKMAAVCVLVSAVLLTGCGGTGSPADDVGGRDSRLVGEWKYWEDPGLIYEFNDDGTARNFASGVLGQTGYWSTRGNNRLTLTWTWCIFFGDISYSPFTQQVTYRLRDSNNTLDITWEWGEETFIRVTQ